MAKRPTLTDLTSLTNSSNINAINQNWDAIQTAFDNTLSLDGSTPNAMNSDIDLNGNSLLNVDTLDVDGLTLNGQTITGLASVPEWRSAWLTATSYAKNDLVKTNGNVYICLVAHTSGTFATDLTALKWELMVSKGDSGAGTGDLVSTNNLSDVANPATSRSNLGLGTVAVENIVPVTKGGTGATDAATARSNLGLGALSTAANVTTSEFAAATLVTEAEGISSNYNDTTIPTSAAVKAYVDSISTYYLAITSNTTWNRPPGFNDDARVIFEAWGGGGGSGRGTGSGNGGPGGGGAYARREMRYADVPSSVSITIGAGGLGRTSGAGVGTVGGTTTIGTLLTAYGGGPGGGTTSGAANGGGGGGELAAGTSAGVGGKIGGGGGGFAGTSTPGGNATTPDGGGGGGSGSADGGAAVRGGGGGSGPAGVDGGVSKHGGNGGGVGLAGSVPGGGGGGALSGNTGGNGARGEVRIWIG